MIPTTGSIPVAIPMLIATCQKTMPVKPIASRVAKAIAGVAGDPSAARDQRRV